jgi:hypothetical protein
MPDQLDESASDGTARSSREPVVDQTYLDEHFKIVARERAEKNAEHLFQETMDYVIYSNEAKDINGPVPELRHERLAIKRVSARQYTMTDAVGRAYEINLETDNPSAPVMRFALFTEGRKVDIDAIIFEGNDFKADALKRIQDLPETARLYLLNVEKESREEE